MGRKLSSIIPEEEVAVVEEDSKLFLESFLDSIPVKKVWIVMILFANLFVFVSFQLFYAKFCKGFPGVVPLKARSTEGLHTPDLSNLINSRENKQIFSQMKFSDQAFYDKENNVVGTTEFAKFNQYQRQPYVANGYIGSRVPNLGQGFTYDQLSDALDANEDDLSNGWPLFNRRFSGAFIAGFYDIQKNTTGTNFPELLENGYESVIAAVPQWTSLHLSIEVDGQTYTLDPSLEVDEIGGISNYAQNLSLSDGIVSTQFTWLDTIHVKYEVLAHRTNINLGLVNLRISNAGKDNVELTIVDRLDFNSSQRCQLNEVAADNQGTYITFLPHDLDYVHGAIYSKLVSTGDIAREVVDHEKVQQTSKVTIPCNSSIQVSKFVGIASSDLQPDQLKSSGDVLQLARQVAQGCESADQVIASHKQAWSETIQDGPLVTFESDPLLSLGARASVFHLLANTRPDAQGVTGALGVGGLSSDSYAGMVFWDADLWMLNGLLPFAPAHAKSLINYRLHTHQQAVDNVPDGYEGAVYPWTSGRFGNCTATGPCLDYEYHINMAVAMAAWQLYISGAADDAYLESIAYPIISDAATFFSDYVVSFNESLNKYTTKNLTDPDEYANHVDNGAYTNSGIALVMRWAQVIGSHLGKAVPELYQDIEQNIYLPTANNSQNITLEYSGMNASVGIKQADVIMMTYPLENELIDAEQAYINMEFYSMKQVSYGPAMTFPIFSIVAASLAPTGCASQSYLQKAIQPFLRGPFAQFSEQNNDNYLTNGGTHPAFPFLTAHGGFLQATLQGLTGLRFDYTTDDNNKLVRLLRLDPIELPNLGDGVSFDGIKYDNHTLSLSINQTHFTITNKGKTNPNAQGHITILLAERNPDHGQYTINDGETQSFALFKPDISFPDSISECGEAQFYNVTAGAFGDASVLINDGDNTTRWQVQYNDTTGKVLVDFKSFKNISAVTFNWADKPPMSVRLSKYSGDKFTSIVDFFAKVDFGNALYKSYKYANPDDQLYNQSEVFEEVHSESVEISAPFDHQEYVQVLVPTRHNTTSIDLELSTRFLLIEVDKIHNTEPIDGDYGGAKLAEVVFY
ncbi:Cell wall acid trehalase ATC1 [Candida viswanathii]|uniref:alpha,alpha-trehalase n=1 Tax=Candida viswanathii TaxID=5486 RepID=A0A367Y429_9ASCO|nr:Cell wall acid trehalase ATC1 [Candida viswanathii]